MRDYRAVEYDFAERDGLMRAKDKLTSQVKAVLDRNFVVSKPVMSVLGSRQPQDGEIARLNKIIFDLQSRIDTLRAQAETSGRKVLAPEEISQLGGDTGKLFQETVELLRTLNANKRRQRGRRGTK